MISSEDKMDCEEEEGVMKHDWGYLVGLILFGRGEESEEDAELQYKHLHEANLVIEGMGREQSGDGATYNKVTTL